jgi:hypothetical protein
MVDREGEMPKGEERGRGQKSLQLRHEQSQGHEERDSF